MDKLAAMQAFVEIADRGSLTAAGQALGRSGPTMVRTLAQLETSLGVRLMRRTTRRLSLTEEGRSYLERCRQILTDVDEAERALGSEDVEPRGEIRMSAPVTFGQWHVAPAAAQFAERYPEARVDLLLLNRVVNLIDEGVDLALRIGPLTDSSMIAISVGRMRWVTVAAPGLLERVGEPARPEELADRPCVVFRGGASSDSWRFMADGREVRVPVKGRFSTNQAVAAVEACAAGLGFGVFLEYQVRPWVQDGRLRVVLEEFERQSVPVSLVFAEARLMTTRLRAFIDFMKEKLRGATQGIDGLP